MNEINAELMRIPNTLLPKIKQELMIPVDKDHVSLTADERVFSTSFQVFCLFIIILPSTEFSVSIAPSIAPSPSKDRAPRNNHKIRPAPPQHLSWHQLTFGITPQLSNEESGIARPPVKRKALLPRDRALLLVVAITRIHLVHRRTNHRWHLWPLSILSKEAAPLDHRTCRTVWFVHK